MEDRSDIEILKAFAKSTHRSIEVKELTYPRTGVGTTQKFKRMVYMSNNPEKTSFFIWFNDPFATIGKTTIFSGAFIPLSTKIKSSINIRKRYFMDKLNVFSKTNINKTGSGRFDSNVIISGHLDPAAKRLLSQSKVQKQILSAFEIKNYLQISMNQYKLDFVPELKDCSYLSVINPQSWEIERTTIETLFNKVEKLRSIIN